MEHFRRAFIGFAGCILALLSSSGCMATSAVMGLGHTVVTLEPGEAYTDAEGNVYFEAELRSSHTIDWTLGRWQGRRRSLGPRYLILHAPGYRQIIQWAVGRDKIRQREGLRSRKTVDVRVRASAGHAARSTPPSELTGWYLYPPNTEDALKAVELPPHLQGRQWQRISREHPHLSKSAAAIPPGEDDETYFVALSSFGIAPSYTAFWAYPAKVLVIATIPLDVVTFPIQAVWAAHYWAEMAK